MLLSPVHAVGIDGTLSGFRPAACEFSLRCCARRWGRRTIAGMAQQRFSTPTPAFAPTPAPAANTDTATAAAKIRSLLADDAAGIDLSWQEDLYKWFHSHPELSGQEEKTAAKIREVLARFNCEVTRPIGGHGLVATLRNGEGPVVQMRADFDALPVQETSRADYASTATATTAAGEHTGVMHACGHDMHTTALLGAVALLDGLREHWSGTFQALFQPAEETTDGALAMVTDGLEHEIDRPDVCLGQHIVAGRAGTVMTAPGPVLAACDSISITIPGHSSHASSPHLGIDPVYTAAHIVLRLQGIVGREVAPSDFAVVSVGTLKAGNTNNSIPTHAELILNCRFYNTDVRDAVYDAIERVVRAEVLASGVEDEPTFRYWAHGELTDNDDAVFSTVRPVFDSVFGEDSITAERWFASEDFSEVPRYFGVPYLFWTVGITPPQAWENRKSCPVPSNHMGTFLPDLSTIITTTHAAVAGPLAYLVKA